MPPTRGPRRTGKAPTAAEQHRAWLELVETDGPFLAVPPLKRVWPQGIPALPADRLDVLREARVGFEHAWEALDRDPDDDTVAEKYRDARDEWVRTVLRDVAGWQESLVWGPGCAPGLAASSPDRRVAVTPDAALRGPTGSSGSAGRGPVIGALVSVVDRCASLHDTGLDGWAATAVDRMEALLRASQTDPAGDRSTAGPAAGTQVGIVTDGRWWALVCARPKSLVASGVVDSQTWIEEPRTRDAFLTVIARQHLIGGDPAERLPRLFADSVAAAEEVTEALGAQVRRAAGLLVQAFGETAAEARRRGLPDPLPADPDQTYSAAVTVLMRAVFLLFAEERGLLPPGELFRQGYGISGELEALEQRQREDGDESLDSTYLSWHRLLATSQALFHGASFENMRMPAYGGSLFDPARYPFLTAPGDTGALALAVSDLVMLHVLESVQVARLKGGDARRISFRDIDVEQVGYIYEGLLGYSCLRVDGDIQIGLPGRPGAEPEVPLHVLEQLADQHPAPAALAAAITGWIKEHQPAAVPPSVTALTKLLTAEPAEEADRLLRTVSAGDDALRARLRRWASVTRKDLRGRPAVVLAGGLLVTETASRRNAGAHYTPKDLATEVVEHALEPLCYFPGPHQTADAKSWVRRDPDEILALKVVDIAAGSGAFLVAAARYLAGRVAEGWQDKPENAGRTDLGRHAIREVVARCLYGADINAMAVEMCKLSLWLVSLDRNLPFSFVDDKILHGNSLLGLTDLEQLRTLHINPAEAKEQQLFGVDLDPVIRRAIDIRRELASEVQEYDPQRSTTAKQHQLDTLRRVTAQLRLAADGVISAGLRTGGKPGKALNQAYENLAVAVARAIPADGQPPDPALLEEILAAGLAPTVATDYQRWQPLHWVLEVPDVIVDHGGFDAVIGNPPFLTGKKITPAIGQNVREWFVNQIAEGHKGNADLVAYFFLRAFNLLVQDGTIGLVATNTIAQGATRETGLDRMAARGLEITRATQSARWPSSSANIEYAAIWGTTQPVSEEAERIANDLPARRISTFLESDDGSGGQPAQLAENTGTCFLGCKLRGTGFIVDPATANAWIRQDVRCREVLFPYLSGDDVNSEPDLLAPRWTIDFGDRSQSEAAMYGSPYRHVEEHVRPYRETMSNLGLRRRWWLHEARALAMRRATKDLDRTLVMAEVSSTIIPVRVQTNQVFSHKLIIFATDSCGDQAVLSSSAHWIWTVKHSVTMRIDPSYSPSVAFATFPRPMPTGRLESLGEVLEEERQEIMLRRHLGLTKLYNLVNDSELAASGDADVARMREIHVQLDEAVMAAYGWSDVPLQHGFHSYRQMTRWTISPAARVEILDRLLEENLRRHAEEAKMASKPVARAERGRTASPPMEGQGTLA
jgi:hypothetical protein